MSESWKCLFMLYLIAVLKVFGIFARSIFVDLFNGSIFPLFFIFLVVLIQAGGKCVNESCIRDIKRYSFVIDNVYDF